MKKCPYCFEVLVTPGKKCSHCEQFFIDPLIESPYKSLEKKKCFFCGKKILEEARICKHCKNWIDKVTQAMDDLD